mmetsp:Transcript_10311/g.18247  ORF Transcript_10311/g.18247 Transcript_10311/m.18247 type:complete len:292 (+) Transcript_10311:3-878(+)
MIVTVTTKIPDITSSESSTESENNRVEERQQSGKLLDLVCLFLRPRVTVFLIEVLVMGAGMATVERLLFLYMVNDLESSTLLCGLSVGVNVMFELPIFWYASPIMKALGHDGMFLLSMACFVFRVYGYTWLSPSTKWWILALESMHGVTFATFWIVTTDVSKVLVDIEGAHWSTAIPMSVQMLYSAVGVSVGSILGGWAMHRFGSREMYTFTAGIVFCMMVVHLVGSIFVRTCCKKLGSLLPDFPHTTTSNRGENDHVQDSGTSNEEDGESEQVPLTSTDIIQIGSLLSND